MKLNRKTSEQSEILILPDGKILAHNITSEMAAVLSTLDPSNISMRARAGENQSLSNNQTPNKNEFPRGT